MEGNYKAMSTVSLFVELADKARDAKHKAEIVAREPWTMKPKALNTFDAQVVKALGRRRELTVGTPDNNNLIYSKLSFPTPEGHGSGGRLMYQLIREHFVPRFEMKSLNDSAVLKGMNKGKIALTTDSYVVSPIFFPGGNIGELAVYGTVNDLAMVGAKTTLYYSRPYIGRGIFT